MPNQTKKSRQFHFKAGCSRVDITHLKRGVGLLGWGDAQNRAFGVESRLFSRAFIIEDPKTRTRIAIVVLDLCFPTRLLKETVSQRIEDKLKSIGIRYDNLCLTATHTHSAPGGFSESMIYNLPNEGVVPVIFETYISGIIKSLSEANAALEPANLYFHQSEFAENVPVAFNRSIEAFNQNPEVIKKLTHLETNLAVDRMMSLLRIEGKNGPLGCINWFGVHATCIKRNHEVISSDNKGLAAELLESEIKEKTNTTDFVAGFAQTTAGDVSPNFIKLRGKAETSGPSKNDFKNRDISGNLQKNHAKKLFELSIKNPLIEGGIDFIHTYSDMSQQKIEPQNANGNTSARTGEGIFGTKFMRGTQEGKGVPAVFEWCVRFIGILNRCRNPSVHGNKVFLLQTKTKKWLGFKSIFSLPIPTSVHPMLSIMRRFKSKPMIKKLPFVPHVLPIQIQTIGPIAIVCLPAEPTTMTGRRVKKTLEPILLPLGITQIIVQGFSNAYSGYITTPEEYEVQSYEGAHTLFGKWTLPAYLGILSKLGKELCRPPNERKISSKLRPKILPLKDLVLRKFDFKRWRKYTLKKIKNRFFRS